jgi:formylglycine-generating enzyme required for sulfatase activity
MLIVRRFLEGEQGMRKLVIGLTVLFAVAGAACRQESQSSDPASKQRGAGEAGAPSLKQPAAASVPSGEESARVALVIGNSKYLVNPLENPGHDADAIASALEGLDFKVTKKKDLDKAAMDDALEEFYRALPKTGMALFFFSGHGLQVKGENYLVPVKAKIREEFEVQRQCLPVGNLLGALEGQHRINVIALDCCRENPFERSWTRSATGQGLAAIGNVPEGTLIAFSTSPGMTASDGSGINSPYTEQLARVLRSRPEQGLELVEVFRDASRAVKAATGQTPWLNMEASLPTFHLWRPQSRPGEKVLANSIGMKLVLIPAGQFLMGGSEPIGAALGHFGLGEEHKSRFLSEYPQHRVRITRPFYLGACPVTRGQFRKFVEATGYRTDAEKDGKGGWRRQGENYQQKPEYTWRNVGFPQTDEHPVADVSWNDAKSFCLWLSSKEGKTYRLPSEAQWEYACRAGNTTRYAFGDDESALGQYAWYEGNSGDTTHPVGEKRPNAFGLYDMHGNVCQWCADWYDANYYEKPATDDPEGPPAGTDRTYRGGARLDDASSCRAACRGRCPPENRSDSLGFRVCLVPADN